MSPGDLLVYAPEQQQPNHSAAKVDWKMMMFDTPSTLPGVSNPKPLFLVPSGFFCRFLRRGTPMTMMACSANVFRCGVCTRYDALGPPVGFGGS